MKYLSTTFWIIVLCSCNQNYKTPSVSKKQNALGPNGAIIIDTFDIENSFADRDFLGLATFHPLFIGTLKDTITLDYRSNFKAFNYYEAEKYNRPDSMKLEIFVDTTEIISSSNPLPPPPPPPGSIGNFHLDSTEKKRHGFFAYPVFIKNIDTDTVSVGYGHHLPLLIEALDSAGIWRPIQRHHFYSCGYGLNSILLPPDDHVITSCKIYKGEYKTKLRLVFGKSGIALSNEFNGTINYTQFKVK